MAVKGLLLVGGFLLLAAFETSPLLAHFLRARRWRDLGAFAVFYWLQILSSFSFGMMMTVAVLAYVGYHAIAVDRGLVGRAMLTRLAAFGAASLVVLLPTHFAYFEV